MKQFRLVFIIVSSIFYTAACEQELEYPLIGTWANFEAIEDTNFNQSLQYTFNSDNTFTVSRIVTNKSTGVLQGYRYKAYGTFEIDDNSLRLFSTEIYNHDDSSGLFSDLDELKLSNDTYEEEVTTSFSNQQSELTFTYKPCGPNENCLGSQTFQRI